MVDGDEGEHATRKARRKKSLRIAARCGAGSALQVLHTSTGRGVIHGANDSVASCPARHGVVGLRHDDIVHDAVHLA
jgi:hypothetical protein